LDIGLAASGEVLHKTRYCCLAVTISSVELPGWVQRIQLNSTGEKVACKSIRWLHNPRVSIACFMECFAAVFQEAVSNQGGLQHCEGSCIIGSRTGDGKLLSEWIRRDNFPQWQ